MTRSSRWPVAVIAGFFILVATVLKRSPEPPLGVVQAAPLWLICLCCMSLYLGSHLLRAIRLAIIGLNIHRTSFRTLVLLHLSVAPWSMIVPFKLDELVRINELRSINGSLARAIMTVIVDRSADGPALLLITAYLATHGQSDVAVYTGTIGFLLVAITIGFFAASHILELVQRHIFLYHYRPRALHMLRIVDHLRALARLGRETILQAAAILVLCTICIWCCEILAVGLLLQMVTPGQADLSQMIATTLIRADSGWRTLLLAAPLTFPAAFITKIFATGLLLTWPPAVWLYCRRRRSAEALSPFTSRGSIATAVGRRP